MEASESLVVSDQSPTKSRYVKLTREMKEERKNKKDAMMKIYASTIYKRIKDAKNSSNGSAKTYTIFWDDVYPIVDKLLSYNLYKNDPSHPPLILIRGNGDLRRLFSYVKKNIDHGQKMGKMTNKAMIPDRQLEIFYLPFTDCWTTKKTKDGSGAFIRTKMKLRADEMIVPEKGDEETKQKVSSIDFSEDIILPASPDELTEEQTEYQKYSQKHLQQNSHEQSLARTVGKRQHERKSQSFVPEVRNRLKNPYISDAANQAEKTGSLGKILSQNEMEDISVKYGIDFNDRRKKTIKGKTGLLLIPLDNGGWKMSHQ